MDKVLVFTNYESWYRGLQKITKRVDWYDSFPEMNNPLVKCVVEQGTGTKLQPVDNLTGEGVYLVYDEIFQDELAPLLDECKMNNDRLFIMLHTNGIYTCSNHFEPWREICVFAKGMHEPDNIYELVFDILTDNKGNEINRIVNSIFLINAVIDFLRECHTPKKDLGKILSYQILCEKGFSEAMRAFKMKYDSCESYLEYKEDYEKLRSLLEEGTKKIA